MANQEIKPVTRRKKESGSIIINQVVLSQIQRSRIDIQNWRNNLITAEGIYNPQRSALYDMYYDVILDAHLASVMQKRKDPVLNSKVVFMRNGEVDEAVQTQIESPWFRKFVNDVLDTISWGYSVFQFRRDGQWINYDLIPRKHIRPEKGLLLKHQYDTDGIKYRDEYVNILEVGDKYDLGLLVKAALYVIYKRNGLGDLAQFAELFGQPIREGIYDGHDDMARIKLKQDMEEMGSSAIFIHPDGTQINLLEAQQKTGGAQLYNSLLSFCNAEISKLYLGNTLTTEQGDRGARSLGEVHLETERDKNRADRQMILHTLNYDLTDIFINLGFNVKGGEFTFEEKEDIDLLEKKHKIMFDWSTKVPVSDDQVYEEFGIEKPDDYDEQKEALKAKIKIMPPVKKDDPEPEPDQKVPTNRWFNFFLKALTGSGRADRDPLRF